jgi:hypothetical protein
MSARVDPGLLKAAKTKTGLKNDSDLISAGPLRRALRNQRRGVLWL